MSFCRENDRYLIDGKNGFLISGEFHYFRVPKKDWRTRLELWREMHGNCVATYIPWCIHEPQEGIFCWNDVENRDIVSFLKLCGELGISVIIRPGPLQYFELTGGGIPAWLYEAYPQIQAQRRNGVSIRFPSYRHPLFLKKARRYFRESADVIRPFTKENGGSICLVQVDNEVMGGQIWQGTLDYNRETVGFGDENGLYAVWLRQKYGSVSRLNDAYHTEYTSFAEVFPAERGPASVGAYRSDRDYFAFYLSITGGYLRILTNIAMGLRGFNIYIYTGGPNFENTGDTCDIYDYHALVHADGSINDTYYAAQRVCAFLETNSWLAAAERVTSVTVAYENEWFQSEHFGTASPSSQTSRVGIVKNGILYSLMCSAYAPGMTDIGRQVPDTDKPLVLCASDAMSRQAQQNVVTFLKNGGRLLLLSTLPSMDEDYLPYTLLRDYIGMTVIVNTRKKTAGRSGRNGSACVRSERQRNNSGRSFACPSCGRR